MIKSAEGMGAMSVGIKKRTNLAPVNVSKSHKQLNTGRKAEAPATIKKTVMAKIVFAKTEFPDQASVEDWIAKAEWEADKIDITEEGDTFVARPAGTDDESFTKMAPVAADEEGVEAFVGEMEVAAEGADASTEAKGLTSNDNPDDKLEESDDDEGDDDATTEEKATGADGDGMDDEGGDDAATDKKKKPVKKLTKRAAFLAKVQASVATKVQKFSGWDAFYAKKSSLSDALEAGMAYDATPPGFYDVQAAFNGVMMAILEDDGATPAAKQESLNKAAMDYADLVGSMDAFFASFIEADETVIAKSFEGTDKAEKLAKWAEDYALAITTKKAVEQPTTEKKAEATVETKAAAPAVDTKTIAAMVQEAVAPVLEQFSELSGTVSKLADRRQQKKSADITEMPTSEIKGEGKPVKKEVSTDDWLRSKQRKALIG
jgi:hypothetical protein